MNPHRPSSPVAWTIPRINQGQIVLVSYGIDEDYIAWERTFDQSDRTTTYRSFGPVADLDCDWDPYNDVPACAQ